MTAAGFRIRRVRSDQSIGDRLKRARMRKKISVAEVEEATKIRAKFILALESDSWEQIPSEVYGRGYLERYLQFLQLPVEEVMKQYDRERSMYARHCQDAQTELSPRVKFSLPRFLLTPRLFAYLVVLAGLVGFGGVITVQVKKFASAPFLELVSPVKAASGATELVVSADSVTVTGRTAIGATVQVNGQIVQVNEDGSFNSKVDVHKGFNSIVIKAISGKGKETTETLGVTVK